jgi:tetratricopeptide (TPR) repeat protein/transcription elongation GreA/GreB family factor
LVLALIEFEDKRYAEAEALARASLAADPTDPQVMELIARCIIVPLQTELDKNPPLPGKLPADVVDRANEAESLFSKAISALEHRDEKELLQAAIANRGMVLSLLGRHAEALSDYDRVLSHNPSQQLVKVNKARLLLSTGRPHEAEQLLENLDVTVRAEAWHPVAVAYLATSQPKKALQVLLPLWANGSDRMTRIRLAELILEAYSDLTDHDAASAVADTLETEFPGDPEASAIAAEWRASQPDGLDRAIKLFYDALDAADSSQKDRITLSLADVYYRARRFSESAELYGKLVPFFDHPAVFRRYLLSLFNAGSHKQALKVAMEKRGGGPALPLVSAIEAHLLEAVGDLDGAERLLGELIVIEPDNPDHRIGLAYLRYRRGDYAGSKQAVLGVAVEEVKGSAHQLLALAKVRAWLDLDGVLELAYRARRVGFDSAEVHQAYVSLFLHRKREQDSSLQVEQIRPGTTVHLEGDDGRQRVFTIVEGLDADLHRGELLPSDPVALKLLGQVPNDGITLKQSELETVTFRIARIESQYVFAFQETLLNFSTWFPDESQGLERLTVDGGGIDKMFQMVGRRHAYVESVLELYRSNRITLGMLAKLVGRSLIQIWSGLQDGGETRIIASTGQEEAAAVEAYRLSSAQELVLDLSAVLTFAALDLLPALKRRFEILLTTQFALDEVGDELTLERAGLRNAGSLYLRGDRYVMEPAPAVTSEQRRLFLETIVEFLKHQVCRLPAPGLLDLPQDQKGPLGKSALASIFLAKERGALFCSDDLVLRLVAQNSWGVTGVWSQTVIIELLRSGCISKSEYHRATMGLVQRNYTFVRVNEQDYLWLLREEGMRLTPRFVNALTVLEGPACTEDSAVVVAGAFLRDICLEPDLRRTRHLLIDACISALKHGRQPGIALSRLEAHVQRLMIMNPEGLSEVRDAIALWKREADLLEEKVRIANRGSGNQPSIHNPRRQRARW